MATDSKTKTKTFHLTPVMRGSYLHVFKPRPPMPGEVVDPNKKKEWSLSGILDPNNPEHKKWYEETKAKAAAVGKAKFPNKKNIRLPFRLGKEKTDAYPKGFDPLPDEYKGKIIIPFSSKGRAPKLVFNKMGEDNKRIPIEDEEDLYSGCFIRVSFNMYAYDNNGNTGVSFSLLSVLKMRDGEPLGNVADPNKEFGLVKAQDGEYDTDNSEELEDDL
jgi:Protein of unknown function (DUF2815)